MAGFVIEGNEEVIDVFGAYIGELLFEPEISKETLAGFTKITMDNLDDIRYRVS